MKKLLCLMFTVITVLSVMPVRADRIVKTLTLGYQPRMSCINPRTNYIYTAGFDGTVYRTDGNTCAELASVAVKGKAWAIACDPAANKVYVASTDSAYITVITEGRTISVTNISLPKALGASCALVACPIYNRVFASGSNCDSLIVVDMTTNAISYVNMGYIGGYMAVNPNNGMVYVCNSNNNKLMVVNGGNLTLATTINVGSQPQAIAVNPVTNKVYVGNWNSNNVSVVDGATNTVTATVSVGSEPTCLAVNPVTNKIFVANQNSAYLSVVNGATNGTSQLSLPAGVYALNICVNATTNKVYATYNSAGAIIVADVNTSSVDTLYAAGAPVCPVVNPVTNRVYVSLAGAGTMAVLDASADSCRAIATAAQAYDITVNPVTNKIYTCSYTNAKVAMIDGATEAVTDITVGSHPEAIAVNPVNGKIYAANYSDGTVSVITGATVTKTITVGNSPRYVAINPVTDKIYVANFNGGTVSIIDGWYDSLVGTRSVGAQPYWIAVNPVTNRVFVANNGNGTVSILDESLGIVDTTLSMGSNPYEIAVNPITNKAYVACSGGNCIKVINGSTYAVSTVATGSGPWRVAVNQYFNRIYSANNGDSSVTVIDGRTDVSLGSVAVCTNPCDVAINPLTNMVYVVGTGSHFVSVIDGATNAVVNRSSLLNGAQAVAVNPVTNRVYVANFGGNNTVVLDAVIEQATGVSAQWQPAFAKTYTTDVMPAITGYAKNAWTPMASIVHDVATTTGSWGAWNWATTPGNGDSVSWTFGWSVGLYYGENFVSVVPFETQLATSNNLGTGATFAGNVLCSPLYYLENIPPTTVWWDSLATDTISPYGPYTVMAKIDDQSNIYSVALKYDYGTGFYSTLTMTKVGIDTFSATIPGKALALGDSSLLYYYIQPTDFSALFNDTVTPTRVMKLKNGTSAVRHQSNSTGPSVFGLECSASNARPFCEVIRYQLPVLSNTKITIFDAAGRQLQSFNEGIKHAGYYTMVWNAAKAGVYFCRMQAGSYTATRKMFVVR